MQKKKNYTNRDPKSVAVVPPKLQQIQYKSIRFYCNKFQTPWFSVEIVVLCKINTKASNSPRLILNSFEKLKETDRASNFSPSVSKSTIIKS